MKSKFKAAVAAGLVLIGCLSVGTVSLASGPSNPAPKTTDLVIGTISGKTKIKQDHIELKTKSSSNVASFTLTYPPGSYSGWHSHPGIVVAVVRAGRVDRQVGCKIDHFVAGQSFTEVGTHRVSNPGKTDAVLEITQIYPADAPSRRIEQSDPCPRHPTS